jgi:signal transduction histidine kinase
MTEESQVVALASHPTVSAVHEPPREPEAERLDGREFRHELRNALTAAVGYAAWLRRRSADWTDERDRRALDAIQSSLRLAGSLIQDDHVPEPRESPDLRRIAAIAVSQVPPLRLGDVVVRILTEDPLVGRWDADRIVQVLVNLLSNAVKYSPRGTPIIVEISRKEMRGRVIVRDRGIGIEAKDLDAIFEGHRTELARLVGAGSGIGLGLSRRLVEAEGGRLGVTSRPGGGSAFWIDLPLAPASPTHDGREQPDAASTSTACRDDAWE